MSENSQISITNIDSRLKKIEDRYALAKRIAAALGLGGLISTGFLINSYLEFRKIQMSLSTLSSQHQELIRNHVEYLIENTVKSDIRRIDSDIRQFSVVFIRRQNESCPPGFLDLGPSIIGANQSYTSNLDLVFGRGGGNVGPIQFPGVVADWRLWHPYLCARAR